MTSIFSDFNVYIFIALGYHINIIFHLSRCKNVHYALFTEACFLNLSISPLLKKSFAYNIINGSRRAHEAITIVRTMPNNKSDYLQKLFMSLSAILGFLIL